MSDSPGLSVSYLERLYVWPVEDEEGLHAPQGVVVPGYPVLVLQQILPGVLRVQVLEVRPDIKESITFLGYESHGADPVVVFIVIILRDIFVYVEIVVIPGPLAQTGVDVEVLVLAVEDVEDWTVAHQDVITLVWQILSDVKHLVGRDLGKPVSSSQHDVDLLVQLVPLELLHQQGDHLVNLLQSEGGLLPVRSESSDVIPWLLDVEENQVDWILLQCEPRHHAGDLVLPHQPFLQERKKRFSDGVFLAW